MKTRSLLTAVLLVLPAWPAAAEIIGTDSFEYPDGAIAGKNGGQLWNYKNTSPTGYNGAPSTWDAANGTPVVAAGKLVTSGNTAAKREYRGANENEGAVNDANVAKKVFYKVTVTTGPSVSAGDYFGISSNDFGMEKIYFGKRGGSTTWGVEEVGVGGTNGSVAILPNTTYTLVAELNFTDDRLRLYVDPNLNGAEPGPGSAAASRTYTGTNWSTAVRFAAGTAVSWDGLVVCTEWDDLATVTVTTAADEDNGSLGGGAGISLREAVKYARAGQRIVFNSSLSGQTIPLTAGQMVIPQAAEIDATGLSGGLTLSGNDASRHLDVPTGRFLTLRGLTLTRGNGSGGDGGSIAFGGTLNLDRCTFSGNASSGSGGAIASFGTLRATDCIFSENTAGSAGGAIALLSGSAELSRCALSANTGNIVGALYQEGANPVMLSHCTIVGNRSTGSDSHGGIRIHGGSVLLQHCTVSQNTGSGLGGGLFLQAPANVTVANCIIAGNIDPGSDRPDVYLFGGTLTPTGTNLIGDNTSAATQFPATPGLIGTGVAPVDAKLSAPGHFGGLVQTLHPLIGSTAIDAITTSNPGGTDARGFPRFVDGNASAGAQLDIGAVEAGPLRTVDSVGELSLTGLRATINASTEPGARIAFSNSLFPATTIPSFGDLAIAANTNGLFLDASNLSGPVTISGSNTSRVFNIPATASVAMHSLQIVNGNSGGGSAGGGILNAGRLSLFSSTFSGNTAGGGAGGAVRNEGTLTLTRSTFSGNTATIGGAVSNTGTGTLTLLQSTFSGNTAFFDSGAIDNRGATTLIQCTLAGNTAPEGGGIGNAASGTLRMTHSIIAGNTATSAAPDLFNGATATITLTGTNFVGNLSGSPLAASATLLTGNPLLAPLGDYGGPTQTMPLRKGSPAREAAGPVSEVQRIPAAVAGVNHRLTFKGQTTALLAVTADAATLQSALTALSTIGSRNVSVSSAGNTRLINFTGALANADQPRITSDNPSNNSGIVTLVEGHPGNTLSTDQRGFARFGLPDLGAFEAQLGFIADVTIKANTATGALPFTVGQVGTLTATSGNPRLLPNANIVLGGSGANRTLTATPAANQIGSALITLTDSLSGETQAFTLTVTAFEVTTLADTASPGSLRQALADAAASPGADLILFAPALSGQTLTLTQGQLLISDANPLTIDASGLARGLTIDANGAVTNHRVMQINPNNTVTLRGLTLTGGRATGNSLNFRGGAIYANGSGIGNSVRLTLIACTLSGNSAEQGGGIYNNGIESASATLSLTACTLSGNSAARGGGIFSDGIFAGNAALSLSGCTLSGNSATEGGGIFSLSGDGSATLTLHNTILAGNTATTGPDLRESATSITATGSNLMSSTAGSNLGANPANITITADPKLSPLGHFGGPVQTMHPLIGSPAIDAAGTTDPVGTDARGFPRFVNGEGSGDQLDIGAVEAGPLTTVDIISDPGGSTALRSRLAAAAGIPGARLGFLASTFPATITLNGTQLDIPATPGLFIDASNLAAPVTISGGGNSRIFNIPATATVAMHSVKIVNGKAPDGAFLGDDGGAGGGIRNAGTLSLFSSTIANNRSGRGVDDNGFRGGDGGGGGGIFSSGTLTLTSCTVSGNTTGHGGNLFEDDEFSRGGIGGSGGGIFISGSLTLTSCTLSANATGSGGTASGIGGGGRGGHGAAVLIDSAMPYRLTACTIAGNQTGSGGNNALRGDGGGVSGGTAILENCLIAHNTGHGTSPDVNVDGLNTVGANLLGTAPSFLGTNPGTAPIINANPLLAPLGDYGGPTQTMPPLPGSPAIDLGIATTAQTDQRGFPRSRDGDGNGSAVPDIGAVETSLSAVTTVTDSGPGSLRQAVLDAAALPGPDTVYFTPAVTGPITLTTEILITDTTGGVTIDASDRPAGQTISGSVGTPTRLFQVQAGKSLTLRGLTLTGGNANGDGGAVFSAGTLLVDRCTLAGNVSAFDGGAIGSAGTLTLTHCTLSGNSAARDGGAISSAGTLTLTHCTLSGNSAARDGGGIISTITGTGTVLSSTLSGNSAGESGGGIHNTGTCTVLTSTLSGNSTINDSGGGVLNRGTCTVHASTLSGNSSNFGGGIFNVSTATLHLTSSIVAGNTAPTGPNIRGPLTSDSNNLIVGTPLLAPLGDYGGPTWTKPPLAGSPAIDAAGATSAFTTDQRGFARVVDGNNSGSAQTDIGAVESAFRFVINTDNSGPGSLRQAVLDAAAAPGWEAIAFASGLNAGTISLTSTHPGDGITAIGITDTDGVAIDASSLPGGLTITKPAGNYRLFRVNDNARLSLHQITLTGGSLSTGQGGAIRNDDGALSLSDCTLTANSAFGGGAIFSFGNLNFTGRFTEVRRCTFTDNTATTGQGGAIRNLSGRTTVLSSTISGNTAPGTSGGGIASIGDAFTRTEVTSSIVSGNTGGDVVFTEQPTNSFLSRGHNLIGTGNGNPNFTQTGDIVTTADPLLAPLADYGGPTPTMALRPGSPARNTGAPTGRLTDQRGFPMIGVPDKGAYEAGHVLLTNYNAYIWETLPATAPPPQTAPTFDFDSDGTDNQTEWLTGTAPENPASAFRPEASLSGGDLLIVFPTITGRTYTLQRSDTLAPGSWVPTGTFFTGDGTTTAFRLPFSPAIPRRFYQVQISQ